MTAGTETLTEAVHAATRPAARRRIGLAVGAFVGSRTVVYATSPVSGDSLFPTGPITEVFTSLALADAVARGELILDTPLAAVLPGTPTHSTGAPIPSATWRPTPRGCRGYPPACCARLWGTVPTPTAP
jgi:CubicO group peptidase (beta-lactamase class C family)